MRACSKAELGERRGVTDLGKKEDDRSGQETADCGKRQHGWFRPDLGEGMGQTWRGKKNRNKEEEQVLGKRH